MCGFLEGGDKMLRLGGCVDKNDINKQEEHLQRSPQSPVSYNRNSKASKLD